MPLVALVVFVLAQPADSHPSAVLAAAPITGVVVDADGKPVSGVDVMLSSGLPPSGERTFRGWALWRAGSQSPVMAPRPVLARARSDADGHFRIDVPVEMVRSQEPLPVALWANGAGVPVASQRLPWATPGPEEPIRLALEKPVAARFRVVGPDGTPDAGAFVVVTAVDRLVVPEELLVRAAAESGADGTAVIAGFTPGDIRAVRVESRRLGAQAIRELRPEAADAMTLRLAPAGRVSGRLVGEAGAPDLWPEDPRDHLSGRIRLRLAGRTGRGHLRRVGSIRDPRHRRRPADGDARHVRAARPSVPWASSGQSGRRGRPDDGPGDPLETRGSDDWRGARARHRPRDPRRAPGDARPGGLGVRGRPGRDRPARAVPRVHREGAALRLPVRDAETLLRSRRYPRDASPSAGGCDRIHAAAD